MLARRLSILVAAVALTAVWSAAELEAQVAFGAQANWGSDSEFGIGGRILGNIERVNLEGVGEFNLFFPDEADFWEINGNLFYHFDVPEAPSVLPYVGGGLNIAHIESGDGPGGDTEVGLNLAGGIRFPSSGDITPYAELRAAGVGADADQLVITGGILFGPGGGR